jgi:hypothetical protein
MANVQPVLLPDHVLSAVLTLAKRHANEGRFAFRSHDYKLQEVFSELAGKYPVLGTFVFSNSGPDPYSPVLNDSVSRLQLSGLIGRENPDYEVIFLRPAAESFFDRVLRPTLAPNELSQLEQIAQEFLGRVTVVRTLPDDHGTKHPNT